ncbi:MAG: hypothetical protein AAGA31_19070 [Bacteroidota bacterium]
MAEFLPPPASPWTSTAIPTLRPTFARGGAAEHSADLMRMKDNMLYFIDTSSG